MVGFALKHMTAPRLDLDGAFSFEPLAAEVAAGPTIAADLRRSMEFVAAD